MLGARKLKEDRKRGRMTPRESEWKMNLCVTRQQHPHDPRRQQEPPAYSQTPAHATPHRSITTLRIDPTNMSHPLFHKTLPLPLRSPVSLLIQSKHPHSRAQHGLHGNPHHHAASQRLHLPPRARPPLRNKLQRPPLYRIQHAPHHPRLAARGEPEQPHGDRCRRDALPHPYYHCHY